MIILASQSPRRKELLHRIVDNFEIIPSNSEEVMDNNLDIYSRIEKLAYDKAMDIYNNHKNDIIIAADTVVYVDGLILGKPKNEEDAKRMIKLLSNNTHEVITGVCVIKDHNIDNYHEVSKVTFSEITEEEINEYIKNPEIYDKAGAYAIQGAANKYILHYTNEYENIVGLPLNRLKSILNNELNR